MTILYAIDQNDWNVTCTAVIRHWLLNVNELMLTIFYDNDILTASLSFPVNPVYDIAYFLRLPNQIFSVDEFHDYVTFGTIHEDIDGTLLAILEKMYSPIFFKTEDFSHGDVGTLCSEVNLFLTFLTELHYKMCGLTVLYIPREGMGEEAEKASCNTGLLKRLETVASSWITSIENCLSDREQLVPNELMCPRDEYEFWVYRYEPLRALQLQTQTSDFKHVMEILQKAQSIFVEPINELCKGIEIELGRTKSNIRYLKLLVQPCNELNLVESVSTIPIHLEKIIHLVRIIWTESEAFNTIEKITQMFTYLGNQIIVICREKLDIKTILKGHPRNGIKIANMSIDSCIAYKLIYENVKKFHQNRLEIAKYPWSLNNTIIFNQIDTFISRLHDLINICNSMIVFGRYDETAKIPAPLLDGEHFQNICQEVEKQFKTGFKEIRGLSSSILNVHSSDWSEHFDKFSTILKSLEDIVENMILNVFLSVSNVEEAIDALCSLYYFSLREKLRPTYLKKTSETWEMFLREINNTSNSLMEQVNSRPSGLPPYAGRALTLQTSLNRIKHIKQMFDKAEWMPESTSSIAALSAYDQMHSNITQKIKELNYDWLDTIESDVSKRLGKTLFNRSVSHPGLLECNIDRSVMVIFDEAKHFEILRFSVPVHINRICQKSNDIRWTYQSVVKVCINYNNIINSLSDKERLLFKPLIQTAYRKITPGLKKLKWSDDMNLIEPFIAECLTYTYKVLAFIDIYKNANSNILHTSEKIFDSKFVDLAVDEPTSLAELNKFISRYRKKQMVELLQFYNDIVDDIVKVYRGFEAYLDSIAEEWIDYISKLDRLIEEALCNCAQNSLSNVYDALHGSGTIEPLRLIRLDLDLQGNKLHFTPSINELSKMLIGIFELITSSLKQFPRLFDKFKLPKKTPILEYYRAINLRSPIEHLKTFITNEVVFNQQQVDEYLEQWKPFKSLWEMDKDLFMGKFNETRIAAKSFEKNFTRYAEIENQVLLQDGTGIVQFVEINANQLRNSIFAHIDDWRQRHQATLRDSGYNLINDLYEYLTVNANKILKPPANLKQMQESLNSYKILSEACVEKEIDIVEIKDHFEVMERNDVTISDEFRAKHSQLDEKWRWYLNSLKDADALLDNCKDSFKENLLQDASNMEAQAKALLDSFETIPTSCDTHAKDALAALQAMRAHLQTLWDQEVQLQSDLMTFEIRQPANMDLIKMDKELTTLEEVWNLVNAWDEAWDVYKVMSFWKIETEQMEEFSNDLYKHVNRLTKQLKSREWTILESTRKKVDNFRKTLPLLVVLKNPSMRERHWDQVKATANVKFDHQTEEFNLDSIIQMKFQLYSDEITDISNAATMELQIEENIANIRNIWDAMTIVVALSENGIYQIKNVDNCFQALEENLVQISTMKSTRFVEPFAKEADYYEKTLNYIFECLENALIVQRQWMYLENIFQGDDIRKQLPAESIKFADITTDWSEITENMYKAKTAVEATHYVAPPILLKKLLGQNADLELIQRALEIYLESKRQQFPRFYFISNDDLLEILGNAKKPDVVQQHFKSLYDNINKCRLVKTTEKIPKWEAHGMISADGEYVKFVEPIILNGPSEKWLKLIENAMRATLKLLLRDTLVMLRKMSSSRDRWLEKFPGQLCLTSCQIQWTTNCTRSLLICNFLKSRQPLKKLRRKQNKILGFLSELSRRDLPKQMRLKVNAVITIEIHSRDVIDKMYKMNCLDVSDFEWFSQLRFYWDREHDNCSIKQTNTSYWYNYEYTGNSGRLVITPLTDRCYITLTTALHLNRGGSPTGPAGTGKTETVKDLGKALGMWVIVNNCSEGMDYMSIGKCFSGLAQTGAWGCFDEFNRINIEVLSVVAQQVLSIIGALMQKLKVFKFEGNDIRLTPTIGMFITMNPGYAGRTELPDNLKSMFRPISMIVPDNVIIADNLLFSDGFWNSKILAKKVFTLYELAKQQLSLQAHYDFGLRSMVALLRYAGSKRRQFPNENEERIVYLAMKDMNIAKLTADDLPLFNGIMCDIFPGVTIPLVKYEEFYTSIEQSFIELGLQSTTTAITKVIQLFETQNSRHSVMILGDTGTAKSVTWTILKMAHAKMVTMGKSSWNNVIEFPLNPKTLSLGELYGEVNLGTGEWLDGVLSSIMRKICSDESPTKKWMLFDGPVDAVWIENMNSVMDDNKVLTLINSERITMPEQVSLLFEVGDLAVASPATVSRCGMVYNDYKDWGWGPYVKSWLQKQKSPVYVKTIEELLHLYMDRVLDFKRLNCKEQVPTNELNLIQSFTRLMDCLAVPPKRSQESEENPADDENEEMLTKMWFFFCLVWSIGATVDEAGREKFDSFIREMDGIFPVVDSVYDYYVNVTARCFIHWKANLSSDWTFPEDAHFYKIIVPTVDTERYNFLVGTLLERGYPVCCVGRVGTGKSSTASSVLRKFNPDKFSVLPINMSAQTSASNLQEIIEGKVEKRTKGVFVPIGGKTMITFIDDFNMPAKDTYGSQHALELVREWIDYGFWYDRKKQWRTYIKQMMLLTAMGPAGGPISSRTLSRFNVINMTFPGESTIQMIFGTMLGQKFHDFPFEVKNLRVAITSASIHLFNEVNRKMLPTPAKMHYLFNLRDISRIFQGLLRSDRACHTTKIAILRLWYHESCRVFGDRLVDNADQNWLQEKLNEQIENYFETTIDNVCPSKESPIFGDFISGGTYEDFTDISVLLSFMEQQLADYNASPGHAKVNLVLFMETIEHVTRIARVVSQPRGNMLLIGLGGSGRQSIVKLAAYICDQTTFQIELTKKYKVQEFREDLKTLYTMVGVQNKTVSFIFKDNQVADEVFLEIINNMLSVGEVPNLFKADELEDIKTAISAAAAKAKIVQTSDAMIGFFMERARSNLHIIMCMSPIGEQFRTYIRQYPALVNNTTIDWFHAWPERALHAVANKYLQNTLLDVKISDDSKGGVRRRESLIETTEDRLRTALAGTFAFIHDSVSKMAEIMLLKVKRHCYVTPSNYLELVTGFQKLLEAKREAISSGANKLRNGIFKIDDTQEKVKEMSEQLVESQRQVKLVQDECNVCIVNLSAETEVLDKQKKVVEEQGEKIAVEETEIGFKRELAQKDLMIAMPALDEATMALNSLNKKDLTEVRSYAKPPVKVEKVMESVMILLKKEPNWTQSKKELGDPNFLDTLKNFDKNHIADKTLKKLAVYTTDPELEPIKVGIVSSACKSLSLWVRAIENYAKIYKVVGPKIELVEELEATLRKKQEEQAKSKAILDDLLMHLRKLELEYENKTKLKEEFQRQAEHLKLKLERAHMLIDGLGGEKVRWSETVKRLDSEFTRLPGDCVAAQACICYFGPFISSYREELIKIWLKDIAARQIPSNEDFRLHEFMVEATDIREWNIQGLPSDDFSTENGIIITKADRWPLIIDPQGQAQKWIKCMEQKNKLEIIDLDQSDYVNVLEKALQTGLPVLLQNVLETLDNSLTPILTKSVVKTAGQTLIKFNDKMITYNDKFRLYITTKLSNPHYSPEIATKTTLVNFTIKEDGLEAQLLGIVIQKERPVMEQEKNSLVKNIANNKQILIQLENEIVRLLSASKGSLLDDEDLFHTLQVSQKTSANVKEFLTTAEVTEAEIDAVREEYRECAIRASILFFVLMDMSHVDPMYQFSLDAYIKLFVQSIQKSPKNPEVAVRVTNLNNYHTYAVYQNTCRGLFEAHKLLFSFHMTISILDANNQVNRNEYEFLLTGGVVLDRKEQMENPCSDWISDINWDNITELEKLPNFKGISESFEKYGKEWFEWYTATEPENTILPGPWQDACNIFQRMLIVRCLRPDRISACLRFYIGASLHQKYVVPPVLDLQSVFGESTPTTPLIFILSAGVDPTSALMALAETEHMSKKFFSLSLGQGQAPIATAMIEQGTLNGNWVYLANCHLSLSWMQNLNKMVETLQSQSPHAKFRLWLSSSPSPQFPLSILQTGIKMTTEPPKGIKANLQRLYNNVSNEHFTSCSQQEKYKKLLFGLCFFHAVLLERKKFQQLGWNVVYSFNDSDFEISENLLSIYLDEYSETPWDALKYLIAGVNYGGHVTDAWDQKLLNSYMEHYYCPQAIEITNFRLSTLDTYYIPRDGNLESYQDYIQILPDIDHPEVFGQHTNADILTQITETAAMFKTMSSIRKQTTSTSDMSPEERVKHLAKDILNKMPEVIDYEHTLKVIGLNKKPLDVVLLQEIERYNKLLKAAKKGLVELQKGINGFVVMTDELDEMFYSMLIGQVPHVWKKAYKSLKKLGSWTRDLLHRVEHFSKWAQTGHPPKIFWLAAFTFPTSFLTAVLQTSARQDSIPIDSLSWEFLILTNEDAAIGNKLAEGGELIEGLFLEGAGWNWKDMCLIDPLPMELICKMPVIQFRPVENLKRKSKGIYQCPSYYYPIRSGSFVIAVDLKSGGKESTFWTKRATAILLSLSE
ncbi:dynein heavy chain 2, axonemal [Bradysia coprophila]|uniref:dynein heavy chain 2, axonemal n=1 Tax=Bradysia coprophila TaxID=38358 RepID=UPI00187D933D|nr:dynein heavy chain 2, axonemal [Bradysia coprophila]